MAQKHIEVECAEWLRQQSDICLAALFRVEHGRTGVRLAELGVAALIANCSGCRSWRDQDSYCVPLTAEDGHPDGFRVAMAESTRRMPDDEDEGFNRRKKSN